MSGLHVLVVEDEPNVQKLICLVLKKSGFVATAVGDGEDALRLLMNEGLRPALVLLDVVMPKVDGITVLKAIRSHPEMNGMPVILLLALSGNSAQLQGAATLATDCLAKPFQPNDLIARVQAVLAKSVAA